MSSGKILTTCDVAELRARACSLERWKADVKPVRVMPDRPFGNPKNR